eukprot:scaffold229657_cov21-Tisochrysis_lutea.AAC.2
MEVSMGATKLAHEGSRHAASTTAYCDLLQSSATFCIYCNEGSRHAASAAKPSETLPWLLPW